MPNPRCPYCHCHLKVAGMLTLVVLLLLFRPVFAVEVEGLYQATVTVSAREDASERQRAFTEGMRQVLIKVTGHEAVFDSAGIRQALNSPENYIDSWVYNTREVPAADPELAPESILEIEIDFFRQNVEQLLAANSIPVWPTNRASTLVWVVEESEPGVRRVLGEDDESELIDGLQREAKVRGIPLLFPLLDLDDRRYVDIEQLWNLDDGHIASISQRYGTESILVIRVLATLGDEFLGRAKYSFMGQRSELELYGDSPEKLVVAPINKAADELAAYYAVRLGGGQQGAVTAHMSVAGINDLQDYAGLLRYVGSLADVSDYEIGSITDDRIELVLTTGGQVRQLVESIALGRSLREQESPTRGDGGAVYLHYRWMD